MTITTRHLAAAGLTIWTAAALVGCSAPAESTSTSGSAAVSGEFPRTVTTVRGEVEIAEAPQRIVVLDSQSADVVAALDVEPAVYDIGTSDSLDTLPWLTGELSGEFEPGLIGADGSLDYEAILETDPDLIIIDQWTATEGEAYDRLSIIAPTITSDVEAAQSWQDRTTFLADALGIADRGETVITETEASIASATAGLSTLADETYHYVGYSVEQGGFWYGNGSWLQDFGLVAHQGQDDAHEEFTVISLENVSDFDSDVLGVWAMTDADKTALQADARFNELPAVQHGKLVWLDYALAVATNVPGPLSTLYMLDEVTPTLEAAVVG
ncbi:ABC transporter substrate-binding protein [Agreia sp.]|uniref:ABC transporter substrate-binding protein n=1 Tax=Agreia sp. TaxID=1872416 RepID=UPI0035BC2722